MDTAMDLPWIPIQFFFHYDLRKQVPHTNRKRTGTEANVNL